VFIFLALLIVACLGSKESKISAFLKWAENNGASVNNIKIDSFDGVRGVAVTREVEEGEEVFRVPSTLRFSCGDLPFKTWAKNTSNPGFWCLVIRLLVEKNNETSFWQPWIQVLPSAADVSTLPLFWTEEELKEILEPQALTTTQALRKDFEQGYAEAVLPHICKEESSRPDQCIGPASAFGKEEVQWAFAVVLTRISMGGIWPVADFMNHNALSSAKKKLEGDASATEVAADGKDEGAATDRGTTSHLVVRASEFMVTGDQVYDDYDAMMDYGWYALSNYGYVPRAEEDAWDIRLVIPADPPKVKIFKTTYNVSISEDIMTWVVDGLNEVLPEPEAGDLKTEDDAADFCLTENKAKAFALISQHIQIFNEEIYNSTTIEDDLKRLEANRLSTNQVLAVRLNLNSKLIRKKIDDLCQERGMFVLNDCFRVTTMLYNIEVTTKGDPEADKL